MRVAGKHNAGLFELLPLDIRYAVRVLFRNPGYTALVIATLALGIGANTAIFSVVYGVLIRPLPYYDGGQLVVLHQQFTRRNINDLPFSPQEVFDYRDHNHTLVGVVEHHAMPFLLLGSDNAERVQAAVVSANFFEVLGVKPLLGRTFVAADEAQGADAVLILSFKHWQQRYHGDPNIVGKVFHMNNRPHTVIGVLPPIPQYPSESDVYMPVSQCPFRSAPEFIANRRAHMMSVFGRLKYGVPLAQAQADLSTISKQLEQGYPDVYPNGAGYGVVVSPLREDLTRQARSVFLILLGASGLVLLIACANVANLFLARLLKLERELAVRKAMGASRVRLVRQLLTESVLVSLGGGALGLGLAPAAMRVLVKFAEAFTTRADEIHLDMPILFFTLLVSLGTGTLFGLAPAFSSGTSVYEALRQGSWATATRSRQRLRACLVVAQVAVSFTLLIGAGLLIRSFVRLQQVNPGFNPDHLLTLRITPSFSDYTNPEQLIPLWDNILRKVRAIGGVESTALTSNFPFSPEGIATGPSHYALEVEGRPVPKGEMAPVVDTIVVSEDYFETLHQPLVSGRTLTAHDDARSLNVAVINQAMARDRWGSEDPVGRRVKLRNSAWITIVGVVGDTKQYGLGRPVGDEIYQPLKQNGFVSSLVVRTIFPPLNLVPLIRSAIHSVDPFIAVDEVETMEQLEAESLSSPRVVTVMLSLFALLAVLVSASGIAAVMALSVSQRANELGIRLALGAQPRSVILLVVRQGAALALCGTAVGIFAALVLTRLLSSQLYATSPTDTFTFAAISILLLAVSTLACFIPAQQVAAIDPLIALRQE
jgi:putative ABC transport system permease protein